MTIPRFPSHSQDSAYDGICCAYGEGWYSVTEDGVEKASGASFFDSTETKTWGSCPTPPPIQAPSHPPCPSGQKRYEVAVNRLCDGADTSFTLTNTCSDDVILSASVPSSFEDAVCSNAGKMQFAINVSYFFCFCECSSVQISKTTNC